MAQAQSKTLTQKTAEARDLIDQRRSKAALKLLHPALGNATTNGEAAQAALVTGIAHFRLGDFNGAQRQFLQATLMDSNDVFAPYYLGLTYERQGKKCEALLGYRLAEVLEPGFSEAASKTRSLREELLEDVPAVPQKSKRRKRHPILRLFRAIVIILVLLGLAGGFVIFLGMQGAL